MPARINEFRMPRYREIPNVGLYLDQTVKYINGYLAPLGNLEITASMVSNYVKKGYISNPVRKQYSAEQIAYLMAMAVVKNVVPMENIVMLFDMQKRTYTVETAYDYFCTELENMLRFIFGLKDAVDEVGVTTSEAKDMLRSVIIAVSHVIYLNSCFDAMAARQEETTPIERASEKGSRGDAPCGVQG
ncbi:MAG: DUF1836 domain-containing protein [Aristaeellaceae bacterium]